MSESLYVQMNEILEQYDEEVNEVVAEAAETIAKEAVRRLKATSPKKKVKGGKYANGWTLKSLRQSSSMITVEVYNSKAPGPTHLLENGHQSYNQSGGSYKYVSARPHIKPVEEWANQEFENEIRRRLE